MFNAEILCKSIPEITILLQYLYIDSKNNVTYKKNNETITLHMNSSTRLVFTNQRGEMVNDKPKLIINLHEAIFNLKHQIPNNKKLYCSRWEEIKSEILNIITIENAKLTDKTISF